jgi:S-adenosylmethionine:tRNA ribosyltransferase-isomerase
VGRPLLIAAMPSDLSLSDFDFDLPDDRIALRPATPRTAARLLVAPKGAPLQDLTVADLPGLLRAGDVLVFNDTRVIPARLFGVRERDGSSVKVEALLHRRLGPAAWSAFMRPGKRLRVGDRLRFEAPLEGVAENACVLRDASKLAPQHDEGFGRRTPVRHPEEPQRGVSKDANRSMQPFLDATVEAKDDGGEVRLAFGLAGPALDDAVRAIGLMPLPPYIAAKRAEDAQDQTDYQTVYAREDGSVAAPTAGLHFTPELLAELGARGVGQAFVTLHVGAGTFLPVKTDVIADHRMHAEYGEVSAQTAAALNAARAAGGRIVCVGTTSLRLLESAATALGEIAPFAGETDIFIRPGYRFRAADALLTNFHLPKSTLLMLVAALAGLERVRDVYAHAVANGYRFYSYGDASLWFRSDQD